MAKKIRAANQLVEMFGRQIPKGRADGYNRTTFRLSKAAKHAMDIRVAEDLGEARPRKSADLEAYRARHRAPKGADVEGCHQSH